MTQCQRHLSAIIELSGRRPRSASCPCALSSSKHLSPPPLSARPFDPPMSVRHLWKPVAARRGWWQRGATSS